MRTHLHFMNLYPYLFFSCPHAWQLRRGFVAVVNRSQKDIKDNVPIEEARVQVRVHSREASCNRCRCPRGCVVAPVSGTVGDCLPLEFH